MYGYIRAAVITVTALADRRVQGVDRDREGRVGMRGTCT